MLGPNYFCGQLRLSCPWKPHTLHAPALVETLHVRLSCPCSPHKEQVRVPVELIAVLRVSVAVNSGVSLGTTHVAGLPLLAPRSRVRATACGLPLVEKRSKPGVVWISSARSVLRYYTPKDRDLGVLPFALASADVTSPAKRLWALGLR